MPRASPILVTVAAVLAAPLLVAARLPLATGAPAETVIGPALSTLGTEGRTGPSGVSGQVWGEPACRKSSPPCMAPARTLEAHVRLVRQASGRVVRELDTDARGEFRIAAPPGSYVLEAVPKSGGTCDPVQVEVQPRRYTEVGVSCTI